MWLGENAYRYDRNNVTLSSGTRWADPSEMKAVLTRVDMDQETSEGCGAPLISDGHTVYVNNSDSHTLVIGSTGSKKTRLVIMPTLQTIARAGESVICTDPKGELYERTGSLFASRGYELRVFNLRDPLHSNGWSILHDAIGAYSEGRQQDAYSSISDFAAALYPENVKVDPFWSQSSRILFSGICNMIVQKPQLFDKIHLNTVRSLLANSLTEDDSVDFNELFSTNKSQKPADLLKKYDSQTSLARQQVEMISMGSEKTNGNIMVSVLAPLGVFFSRPSLTNMLSTQEICLSEIGLKKTAVFIILPDEKTTLNMLVSLFIKRSYEELIRAAQNYPGQKLPVRVNYVLDEFCNVPTIPDMNAMISAARSRNIRFQLVVQGFHQLVGKYDHDADNIKGNCNDWIYLASREWDLLQELSNLCGHDESTGKCLISTTQLQHLRKDLGEALLLCNRCYPMITYLADISQYPASDRQPVPFPQLGECKQRDSETPRQSPQSSELKKPPNWLAQLKGPTPVLMTFDEPQKLKNVNENKETGPVTHHTPIGEALNRVDVLPPRTMGSTLRSRIQKMKVQINDVAEELEQRGIRTIGNLLSSYTDQNDMNQNLNLKHACMPPLSSIVRRLLQMYPDLLRPAEFTTLQGRYKLQKPFRMGKHDVWQAWDSEASQGVWVHIYNDELGRVSPIFDDPSVMEKLEKVDSKWILKPIAKGLFWGQTRYVITPAFTYRATLDQKETLVYHGLPVWLSQYIRILKAFAALGEAGLSYGLLNPYTIASSRATNDVALFDFRTLTSYRTYAAWRNIKRTSSKSQEPGQNPLEADLLPEHLRLPWRLDEGTDVATARLLFDWFVEKTKDEPISEDGKVTQRFIESFSAHFKPNLFKNVRQVVAFIERVIGPEDESE